MHRAPCSDQTTSGEKGLALSEKSPAPSPGTQVDGWDQGSFCRWEHIYWQGRTFTLPLEYRKKVFRKSLPWMLPRELCGNMDVETAFSASSAKSVVH